ncbi:hypothetical protein J2S01_001559 [Pectinatus haikarae]|uniref:Uncharacterized protein n=1 Tax=Pectinatus haikarae TaxID=349096 RepID=A0ABT9Y7M2_9FIRM|nr:hypothetical protein [Pectinatus haikarae]
MAVRMSEAEFITVLSAWSSEVANTGMVKGNVKAARMRQQANK